MGCLLRLDFALPLEEGGQSGKSRGFPGADLVGMDAFSDAIWVIVFSSLSASRTILALIAGE